MLPADTAVGVGPVQVLVGVNLCGDDFKQVGVCGLGNCFGYPAGVAGSGVVDHQGLIGSGVRFGGFHSLGGFLIGLGCF